MNTLRKFLMITAGALVFSAPAISAASARCSSGEIANFLCNAGVINKPTANTADGIHAGLGRPLDHLANQAAGAVANYIVPGSGPYVTQGLELRDQYNRGMFGGGAAVAAPTTGTAPMVMPMPQMRMGMFCATPQGVFGPGPVNPWGSFCQVPTPNGGILVGRVI